MNDDIRLTSLSVRAEVDLFPLRVRLQITMRAEDGRSLTTDVFERHSGDTVDIDFGRDPEPGDDFHYVFGEDDDE